MLACLLWVDRDAYPGGLIFNPETEGCLPMKILLADSTDRGRTWTPLREVPMPADVGPPSLTSPDPASGQSGRLLLSVETNKEYLDASQWFQRVVYLYSSDEGRTWTPPVTVCADPTGRIRNWDQRVNVAPDGRLVSFTWTYDSETVTYQDIHRRISTDEGLTWTERRAARDHRPGGPPGDPPGRARRAARGWTISRRIRCGRGWRRRSTRRSTLRSEVVPYEAPAAPAGEGGDGGEALRRDVDLDVRFAVRAATPGRVGPAGRLPRGQGHRGRHRVVAPGT